MEDDLGLQTVSYARRGKPEIVDVQYERVSQRPQSVSQKVSSAITTHRANQELHAREADEKKGRLDEYRRGLRENLDRQQVRNQEKARYKNVTPQGPSPYGVQQAYNTGGFFFGGAPPIQRVAPPRMKAVKGQPRQNRQQPPPPMGFSLFPGPAINPKKGGLIRFGEF